MQPLPPPGRPDPRTQALFKRNALQMGPLSEDEPKESVELLHRPPPKPDNRHLAEAEALERERNKKVYRRPTYPPPPPPLPRRPAAPGGWMLSAPTPQPKSREMREDELAIYSRHRQDPLVEDEPPEQHSAPETEELDPQLARWVNALLKDPPGTPGRAELARLLAPFGIGILRLCQQHGLSVLVADTTAFLAEQNRVEALPGDTQGFLIAFALAYDVALGKGQAASVDSLAVLTHFQMARSRNPHLESPSRFFAQAVAGYFTGDCAMPAYVEYLIQQSRQAQGEEQKAPNLEAGPSTSMYTRE